MADVITINEWVSRLDAIRHEIVIVPDSRDYFALSAGIAALCEFEKSNAQYGNEYEDGKKAGEKETLLRIADSFKDITDKTETCIKAALGWEDEGCYLDCAEYILNHYGIESETEPEIKFILRRSR